MPVVPVLARRLEIGGANAVAGMGAVGYPALTAFLGYAQELARALAGERAGRHLRRFAVLHHTGRPRLYGTYRNRVTQKSYAYFEKSQPAKDRQQFWFTPSADFRPQVDLTVSLVLEVTLSDQRLVHLQAHAEEAAACIGLRALGGMIKSDEGIVIGGDALDLIKRAGRSDVVVDRTSCLFENEEVDALDALLDQLATRHAEERRFVSHIGYLGVSDLAMRTTARGDAVQHQYAEPIFGLAAFRRSHALEPTMPFLWAPSIDRESGVHVLKGEAMR